MDKFNLSQFECRIRNLINLVANRKKLNVFFPTSVILNITNQSCHHFSTILFKMCIFSYGHLFLASIFYQLTSEKNQVHTGDLTHCKQTLQLIKFYLIKNMKGNRGNWQAQFKFTFLSILWSFLLPLGKVYSFPHFTVFCSSVCFSNNLNYCCQQVQGAYKMCTVINTLIPESDYYLISPFNVIPKSSINVMRIKEMIINWRTSWLLNKFSLPAHQEMH